MTISAHGKPWLAVAKAYGEGQLTIREICERHGVSVPALYARARLEGWPPRRRSTARWLAVGEPTPADDIATEATGATGSTNAPNLLRPRPRPQSAPQLRRQRRRNFIRRLYDAMETKLSMIEERLEAAKSLPPSERGNAADTEREIRAFDAMARSFDRVATLDETHNEPNRPATGGGLRNASANKRGDAAAAGRDGGGDAASADAELELWRDELAARIRRLRNEWSA